MRCLICGNFCPDRWCGECERRISAFAWERVLPDHCPKCGYPLLDTAYPCGVCDGSIATYGCYGGSLRQAMLAFKRGERGYAPLFAKLIRPSLDLIGPGMTVVPVPASRRSRKRRGFDQAEEIARYCGHPVVRALVHGKGAEQKGRTASDRKEVFFLPRRHACLPAGSHVILLDDIVATGSTLKACRSVLESRFGVVVHPFAVCLA